MHLTNKHGSFITAALADLAKVKLPPLASVYLFIVTL